MKKLASEERIDNWKIDLRKLPLKGVQNYKDRNNEVEIH